MRSVLNWRVHNSSMKMFEFFRNNNTLVKRWTTWNMLIGNEAKQKQMLDKIWLFQLVEMTNMFLHELLPPWDTNTLLGCQSQNIKYSIQITPANNDDHTYNCNRSCLQNHLNDRIAHPKSPWARCNRHRRLIVRERRNVIYEYEPYTTLFLKCWPLIVIIYDF